MRVLGFSKYHFDADRLPFWKPAECISFFRLLDSSSDSKFILNISRRADSSGSEHILSYQNVVEMHYSDFEVYWWPPDPIDGQIGCGWFWNLILH